MFVSWAKAKSGTELENEVVVETALPDDAVASSDAAFEVNVHNVILDNVVGLEVFSQCKTLDFACLDPPNFAETRANGLPNSALQEMSKCPLKFNDNATISTLHAELYSLTCQWERLKKTPQESYIVRIGSEEMEAGEENGGLRETEVELESRTASSCKKCPICVHMILSQYNLLAHAYTPRCGI